MTLRTPVVAGKFYEGNAKSLYNYAQATLDVAQQAVEHKDKASMILLPHAGHFYCGHIIAETLACVDLPDTLFLLGPNHTGKGKSLAVWETGAWQTPLGDIPIDEDITRDLLQSSGGFEADTNAHMAEHSLEVILPFLQIKMPNVRIVPIAISGRYLESLQNAGYALGDIMYALEQKGINTSIVVSSDMHHFSDHETTLELDKMALQSLMEMNPVALANVVGKNKISMCGVCPAIVALYALKKLNKSHSCHLVRHTTSYEKSNDAKRVVGYAGLFVKENTCQTN